MTFFNFSCTYNNFVYVLPSASRVVGDLIIQMHLSKVESMPSLLHYIPHAFLNNYHIQRHIFLCIPLTLPHLSCIFHSLLRNYHSLLFCIHPVPYCKLQEVHLKILWCWLCSVLTNHYMMHVRAGLPALLQMLISFPSFFLSFLFI